MRPLYDPHALTDMAEDVDTHLTEQQREAVRRLICSNASGDSREEQVADALDLMHMLGVHPDDPIDDGLAPFRPAPNFLKGDGFS